MKGLAANITKNLKNRAALFILFALTAVLCITAAVILPFKQLKGSAETEEGAVYNAMLSAADDFVSETVILLDGSVEMDGSSVANGDGTYGDYIVKAGQTIRFAAAEGAQDVTLTFSNNLVIEAEAKVCFDVETVFTQTDTKETTVSVYGTMEINQRLRNTATIIACNSENAFAEIKSEGVIIGGSLNNDVGGVITVNSGATLETKAYTQTTVTTESGEETFSNNDGGSLLLKAYQADGEYTLGLNVEGTLQNNGSVIYQNGEGTATAVNTVNVTAPQTSGNPAVGAVFIDYETVGSINVDTSYTTYVLYADGNKSFTLDKAYNWKGTNTVNLLAFGKITLVSSSYSFTFGNTVSLGGGVTGGVTFTQGANELIFDGGAEWTKGTAANYSATARTGTIFYNENNEPYYYTNGGTSHTTAFFIVSGKLSLYGGVKITNYAMTSTTNRGGGVNVNSGATFTMYGGEISYCAVTNRGNDGTGSAIYTAGGAIYMYGGAVTHNAASTTASEGSADGAGISVDPSGVDSGTAGLLYLYGGEISYNHGACGTSTDVGADGGGVMLRYSVAYVYGGEIRGNFTGGTGGGVSAWCSYLAMYGGTITENRAAFGGGVGAVANNAKYSSTNISGTGSQVIINGGSISDNEAFRNYNGSTTWGGYGGGVCAGSEQFSTYSTITIGGDAQVSGNKAYYGGGLAVYTKEDGNNGNQLKMTGGAITGNGAYLLPSATGYQNVYSSAVSANGGGVYVSCSGNYTSTKPMLDLSNTASIDSSNSVSIGVTGNVNNVTGNNNYNAPIYVSGALKGNGLGALVYLGSDTELEGTSYKWSGKNIIGFAGGNSAATQYLDKFLLDSVDYAFTISTSFIRYTDVLSTGGVARIVRGNATVASFNSVEAAVKAAQSGDVIEILASTTVSSAMSISKDLTIRPDAGKDVTVAIASSAALTGSNGLFTVSTGCTLTLEKNGENSRLTVDGNGVGRKLEGGADISLFVVDGGELVIGDGVYIRNNLTSRSGSAVHLSSTKGSTFTMNGGVIEANTSTVGASGAVYLSGDSSFYWNGGTIAQNVNSSEDSAANYGIYLSSDGASLYLNNTVTLTDNVIYVGAATIVLESDFNAEGSSTMQLVLPSASSLTAGNAVVCITKRADTTGDISELSSKFEIYNNTDGIELVAEAEKASDSVYSYYLVIYKTAVFYLDARFGENAIGFDEQALGAAIGAIIGSGATKVVTRYGGTVLVVSVRYKSTFSLTPASTLYAFPGYTLMGWSQTADSQTITNSYDNQIEYTESPYTLYAVWQANTYTITFNSNAPATVEGSMEQQKFTYGEEGASLAENNFTVTGYVFTGWALSDGDKAFFTDKDGMESSEIASFSDTTSIRGSYSLNLYAVWECLFEEGVGSSASPFVISTLEQLEYFEATVNGKGVNFKETREDFITLNVPIQGDSVSATYYNTHAEDGSLAYVPESYGGYYFKLGDNIGSQSAPFNGIIGLVDYSATTEDGEVIGTAAQQYNINKLLYENSENGVAGTPFAGSFDGNGHTVYLNINAGSEGADTGLIGAGLFGMTDHATIKNLVLEGSVVGQSHLGALVGFAYGGTFDNITNNASVSSDGYDVGGVFGTFYEKSANRASQSINDVANNGKVIFTGTDNTPDKPEGDGWEETGVLKAAVGVRFGGIIGNAVNVNLTNAYNTGDVIAKYGVGGVIGTMRSLSESSKDATAASVFNTGNIVATSGLHDSDITINTNGDTISGDHILAYVGGVIGRMVGSGTLSEAFNSGSVSATYTGTINDVAVGGVGAGGVVGMVSYDVATAAGGNKSIEYVYNTGSVSAYAIVGGILGYLAASNLTDSFNGGNVEATGTLGNTGKALLGAVVGYGVSAVVAATVYYNMDMVYKGFTDTTVQAIGDLAFVTGEDGSGWAMGASGDSSVGLTSTMMKVGDGNLKPQGFATTFFDSEWSYYSYDDDDDYYYYPQLNAFSESTRVLGTDGDGNPLTVAYYSKESVRLTVPDEEEEKPLEPTNEFKVTYVLNGGKWADGNEAYVQNGNGDYYITVHFSDAQISEPVSPVRTGYAFEGWYIDNGTFTALFDFNGGASATDLTLYAKWNTVEYAFIYELAGGTLSGDYSKAVEIGGDWTDLATEDNATKNGYSFTGWSFEFYTSTGRLTFDNVTAIRLGISEDGEAVVRFRNGDIIYSDNISLSLISDPSDAFHLQAQWEIEEYGINYIYAVPVSDEAVTYDYLIGGKRYIAVDGSAITNTNETVYTIEDAVIFYGATFAGYDFSAWYTESGSDYAVTNSITKGSYGDRTVIGVFEPKTYTITFDVREGGNIVDPYGVLTINPTSGLYYAQVTYGTAINLGEVSAERVGYDFRYWSLSSATEEMFETGEDAIYSFAYDITLYAVYADKTFTLTVSAGEGYFDYGDSYPIWMGNIVSNANGVTSYTVTVKYGVNLYTYLPSADKVKQDNSIFSYWADEDENTLSAMEITEDLQVCAIYSPAKFGVTFINSYDGDKNSVTFSDIEHNTALSEAQWAQINTLASAKAGYEFKGWYVFNTETKVTEEYLFTEYTVVEARYEAVVVTVTLIASDPYTGDDVQVALAGGTYTENGNITLDLSLLYSDVFGTLAVPEHKGYVFAGWYTEDGTLVTANTAVASLSFSDGYEIVLTAQWTEINYTITYVLGNTGSALWNGGSMPSIMITSYTYKDTFAENGIQLYVALEDGTPVAFNTGYILDGWLLGNTAMSALQAGTAGNLTLSAHWTIELYTVTVYSDSYTDGAPDPAALQDYGYFIVPNTLLDGAGKYYTYEEADGEWTWVETTNGGDKAYKYVVQVAYGGTAVQPVYATKTGYLFSAWEGSFTKIEKATVITATYQIQSYNLYLYANGGLFTDNESVHTYPSKVAYGSDIAALLANYPAPVREGYTFAGWFNYSGEELLTMPANDVTLYAQWEAIPYTVSIAVTDTNDSVKSFIENALREVLGLGADEAPALTVSTDGDVTTYSFTVNYATDLSVLNVGRPENTDENTTSTYVLSWYLDDTLYSFTAVDSNLEITAQWISTDNAVKVTFNKNDGEDSASSTEYVYYYTEGNEIVLPEVTRTGYTFVGWYDESGTELTAGTTASADITYYAKWEAVTYYATLVYNDGVSESVQKAFSADSPINFEEEIPERAGYDFAGWYLNAGGAAMNGEEITTTEGIYANITVYAQWTPKQYLIIYSNYANNQTTFENFSQTMYFGTEHGMATLWSRDYYTVKYYFSKIYEDGIWKDISVENLSVEFKQFTSLYTEELDALYNVDDTYFVKVEDFAYLGSDGTTYYWNGYVAYVCSVFTPLEYNVTYKGDGVSITDDRTYTFEKRFPVDCYGVVIGSADWQEEWNKAVFDLAYPSAADDGSGEYTIDFEIPDGKTFVSWGVLEGTELIPVSAFAIYPLTETGSGWAIVFLKQNEDGNYQAVLGNRTVGETITLYPVYDTKTYIVTLDPDNGAESVTEQFVYNQSKALPSVEELGYSKTGYTFGGWQGSDGLTYVNGQILTLTADESQLTLTAIWTPVVYEIWYDTVGGAISGNTMQTLTYSEGLTFNLPETATKLGYSFAGWIIDGYDGTLAGNVALDDVLPYANANNRITVKAVYEAVTYSLVYESDGETVQTIEFNIGGDPITLITHTKEGYSFDNWLFVWGSTSITLSGGHMASAEELIRYADASNLITLTAQWTAVEYTITYELDGGENSASNPLLYTVETPAFTLVDPVKAGYKFTGWTDGEGNAVTTIAGGMSGDITLTANWALITYSVTYVLNGGAFDGEDIVYEYSIGEVAIALPENVVKAGFNFAGWLDENGDTVTEIAAGTSGDRIFIAQWAAYNYKVVFEDEVGGDYEPLYFDLDSEVSGTLLDANEVDGYVFNGWTVDSITMTGGVFYAYLVSHVDTDENGNPVTVTENGNEYYRITFTANRSVIEYSYTYVYNDGTGIDTHTYTVESETITLIPPAERTGYDFAGWYYSNDPAETDVPVTEIAQGTCGNITLYAKWDIKTFAVTVSSGEGKFSEDVPAELGELNDDLTVLSLTVAYGSDIYSVLSALQGYLTLENSHFFCWNSGDEQLSSFVITDTATITAVYNATQVSITYIKYDGSSEFATSAYGAEYTAIGNSTIGDNVLSWVYYGDETVYKNGTQLTSSIVLKEVLTEPVEVEFVSDGQTVGTITVYHGKTYGETSGDDKFITSYAPEGYVFGGWYYEVENTKVFVTSETTVTLTDGHKLYALLAAVNYTVIFDLNGGSSSNSAAQTLSYDGETKITMPDVTRVGYSFSCWTVGDLSLNGDSELASVIEYAVNNVVTIKAEWEVITYTVNINDYNGTTSSGSYTVDGENTVISLGYNAEKVGYTFVGWAVEVGENAAVVFDSSLTSINVVRLLAAVSDKFSGNEITLYGVWSLDTYNIIYSLGGGEWDDEDEEKVIYSFTVNDTVALVNPVRAGYRFVKWVDESGKEITEIAHGTAGNVTLVAVWEVIVYTVNLTDDDGNVVGSLRLNNENAQSGLLTALNKAGYTFGGWLLKADGYTLTLAEGSVNLQTLLDWAEENDIALPVEITLTPVWTANTYTVTLVSGGEVYDTITVTYNEVYSKLGDRPEKKGYSFDGWYLNGSLITENTTVTQTGDHTLVASWLANEYTVEFNANNGTNRTYTQSFVYGTETTLNVNTFTKEGYTFIGWATEKDGSVKYSDGASVLNLTADNGGTVTLYAVWQVNVYTLTVNIILNEKAEVSSVMSVLDEYFESADIVEYSYTLNTVDGALTLIVTVRANYRTDFNGLSSVTFEDIKTDDEYVYSFSWNNDSTFGFLTGDSSVTGGWSSDGVVTVTFDNSFVEQLTRNYTANVAYGDLPEIAKTGYDFLGWFDADGNPITAGMIAAANVTYYAHWQAKTYTVEFDLNGADSETDYTATLAYGANDSVTLPEISRLGYTFAGWTVAGTPVTSDTLTLDDLIGYAVDDGEKLVITVTAQWTSNSYAVMFDPANGEQSYIEQYVYPDNTTVELATPSKNGYTFGGWSAENGAVYSGESVELSSLIAEGSNIIKLTAKWEAVEYTVKYYDGATALELVGAVGSFTLENTLSFNLPAYDKGGYTFNGWKLGDVTLTGVVYGANIIGYADEYNVIVFTADLTVVTYAVRFITSGGTPIASLPYTVESGLDLSTIEPTRNGYEFMGWYATPDCDGEKLTEIPAGRYGNVTVYAGWDIYTFTVTVSAGKGLFATLPDGLQQDDSGNVTLTFEYGADIYARLNELQNCLTAPADYRFLCWSSNGEYLKTFVLYDTAEITATFSENDVSVTLIKLDGTTYFVTVPYGKAYEAPSEHSELSNYTGGYIWVLYGTEEQFTTVTSLQNSIVLREVASDDVTVILHYGYEENDAQKTETISVAYNSTYGAALPVPERAGYTFSGWYYENAENVKIYVTADTLVSSGAYALYAEWKPITYTVIYNLNGGSGNILSETVAYSDEAVITLPSTLPERAGYTFVGWSYDGENPVEVSDEVLLSSVIGDTNIVTLTAIWEKNVYTVSYENDFVQSADYGVDDTLYLPATSPERAGYNFLGWVVEYNGAYITVASAGAESIAVVKLIEYAEKTGDYAYAITLKALWSEPVGYTLTFNVQGGMQVEAVTFTVESGTIDLSGYVTSRIGYNFLGWSLDGVTVTEIDCSEYDSSITLTAVWSDPIVYTITYNYNYDMLPSSQDYTVEDNVALLVPVRQGYTFLGWYENEECEGSEFVYSKDVAKDLNLYAKWTVSEYAINYVLNGGEWADVTPDTSFTVESTVTFADPVRTGYTFGGWYTTAAFTDESEISDTSGRTGELYIFAKWTALTYTVSFDLNGGDGEAKSKSVTYGSLFGELPAPTRNGYIFAGWYLNGERISAGSAVLLTEDTTLTAEWSAVSYNIAYELNGGKGDTGATYTVESVINLPVPVREGYAFGGWYDNAELDGETVTVIPVGSTGDKTFYAAWKIVTYKVTYILNGGTNDEENITVYDITSESFTLKAATRTGYQFNGWRTADGGEITTVAGGTTGDIVLYAEWASESYLVTFDYAGGTGSVSGKTVEYGVSYGELPVPVRTDYTFGGWVLSNGRTVVEDTVVTTVGDHTLTAVWLVTVVSSTVFTDDGGMITVTVKNDAGFDDGIYVVAELLTDEDKLASAAETLGAQYGLISLYDITLFDANGQAVSPSQMIKVYIDVPNHDPNASYMIVHFAADGSTSMYSAFFESGSDRLCFLTDHFSEYAVVKVNTFTQINVGGSDNQWLIWLILIAIVAIGFATAIAVIVKLKRYEIAYISNGGGSIGSVRLRDGDLVTMPIPEREGYVFDGWYYDEEFTQSAYITTMPNENLIVFAKWIKKEDTDKDE